MRRILLLLFMFISVLSQAQSKKKKMRMAMQQQLRDAALLANNLRTHLQALSASEPFHPSANHSGNDTKAIGYLIQQYEKMGIAPLGTDSGNYIQPFVVDEGKHIIDAATFFTVNEQPLQLHNDFFPLACSRSMSVKGAAALALNERKQPWFKDLKDMLEENAQNPLFNIAQGIRAEVEKAAKKGALSLCLYNSSKIADNIQFLQYDTAYVAAIPVIYITKQGINRFFKDYAAFQQLHLGVAIGTQRRKAQNIVAYINNHASNTVVIGSCYHYLSNTGIDTGKKVPNPPNNNVGGTAVLLELARLLNTSAAKNNNYVLLHFSGKSTEALGRKYWLQKQLVNSFNINYYIDLCMPEQSDTSLSLTASGVATSSVWLPTLSATSIPAHLQIDSSSVIPAEYAHLHEAGIPALFFGANQSFASPFNTIDANYTPNIAPHKALVQLVYQLVLNNNIKGKLPFTPITQRASSLALP